MKKWMLLSIMLGAVQLSMMAQDDDLYFVPTKANVAKQKAAYGIPQDTYYSGSSRSVDEYNRRVSSYEVLPADTGDVISFSAVEGVYPDSLGDFALTRQMQRWDNYEPSQDYWDGYNRGRSDSWNYYGWHSPWWYSSYYPWYDYSWGWYDPWYYGSWYGGWYDPWWHSGWGWGGYYSSWYHRPWSYYGWYGGGYGGYYGGRGYTYRNGTENHGRISGSGPRGTVSRDGRSHSYSGGTFSGGRTARSGNFGSGTRSSSTSSSSTTTRQASSSGVYSNSYGNFGGSRSSSSSSSSAPSRSYSSGSSSSGGGSFGGSRSSGGSVGGSRSGGGSFGGGRR